LKYKDGDKKIIVTPDTTVVTYVPQQRRDQARIFTANKKDDGTLDAKNISVGRDVAPPM
jgi:hypothetical protein